MNYFSFHLNPADTAQESLLTVGGYNLSLVGSNASLHFTPVIKLPGMCVWIGLPGAAAAPSAARSSNLCLRPRALFIVGTRNQNHAKAVKIGSHFWVSSRAVSRLMIDNQ